MSASTSPTVDYARAHLSVDAGAWRLLRLAAILWASLVLCRHATYWGGVIAERFARSGGSMIREFPFAEIGAAAEAVILFTTLVIALGHKHATPNAVRGLRLLGAAFILLVVAEYLSDLDSARAAAETGDSGRTVLRMAWGILSKLQLLVVPAICAIGPRR